MTRFLTPRAVFNMTVVLAVACSLTLAQEDRQPDAQEEAEKNVNRLAAKKEFLRIAGSHQHRLPEDKVREIVLNALRQIDAPPPKRMPTPQGRKSGMSCS